jgi:signal transduction histidine kinase/CheY-like chemotaxis protein
MADPTNESKGTSPPLDELARLRAEHATVVRALQEAIRDTTRLTRLFAVLNEVAPLEILLDRVLATLSELFVSDIVVLFDGHRERELVPLASVGLPAGIHTHTIPTVDSSHASAALECGTPVVANEARKDPEVDSYLRDLDVESAVWLRVCGDSSTCRGVLVLARCRPVPFVQADVDLLAAMAYRIGVMVERDRTEQERRRLDLRLRQVEKTESLGRMATAISHHFNNMLAVIVASLEVTLEALPKDQSVYPDLLRAREATTRAAKTSDLMLAYLGQSAGTRESIDFCKIVNEALPDLLSSLPSHVRCTSDLRESGLMISASPPQIIQLLGNLITNAWEAMDGGPGTIDLSIRSIPKSFLPKSQLSMGDWNPKAVNYACLTVTDDGCGMSPEILEKIFDPFFTTKFVGRGLGLPVVQGIVRAYEGLVTVESKRSLGTTVRTFLPILPRAIRVHKIAVSAFEKSDKKTSLALMAEDEEHLRRATQRMLNRMGYEVLATTDGMDALVHFRQRADEIQFMMLDIAMPRMDGWTALEAIRELRPNMPVILTSGYDEQLALKEHPAQPLLVFLHKPYTMADLKGAIQNLLAMADNKTTSP